MRRVTNCAGAALLLAFSMGAAQSFAGNNGSVNVVNAYARASGSDLRTAVRIGKRLFLRQRSAQILKIYAESVRSHRVAGVMLSGVKFHHPLTRAEFIDEVAGIVTESFAAAPVEEVDLWCVVPLNVGKGVVVSGDNAQPTQRTVFAVTVRRGEAGGALRTRIGAARMVYWDTLWARQALLQRG